jgi:hypothetical protein
MTEHAVYFKEVRIPVLYPLYKLQARCKSCEQRPTARNCSPDARSGIRGFLKFAQSYAE